MEAFARDFGISNLILVHKKPKAFEGILRSWVPTSHEGCRRFLHMLKGKFKKVLDVVKTKMTINIRRGNKHLVEIMGKERKLVI